MPLPCFRRGLLALALAAVAFAAAPAADAQADVRVIRSWVDDVKLDDGTTARWTVAVTYDADAGQYARIVTDASGAVIERTVSETSIASPNEDEVAQARALILADPELRSLYDQASNPTLEGGFVLQREAGHPCGPGSRCLQFDMYNVDHAARRVDRIRYVVVNLQDHTLVSRNFDADRNSNATRFNEDRRTDAR